ncbi:tail completion or Neck1 protein [Mycobacterium phage Anthony]|uniref:Uncharacterized protein n=1 Tax=Mycobacterium phage Anthony TaxID=2599857 RepID=A0A5J6TNT7_9CAUD|nr:tail completion or Neck1 protein [Mycobacterium phage Anthony]QFG10392.1 hypothetical protein PBI_ANTHONY_20 [Mycobacterium phage Anthony]
MAQVYRNAGRAAARHVETRRRVRRVARGVEHRARINLLRANKSERITATGYFPAFIDSAEKGESVFIYLNAPNPVALEFGHMPSGVFAGTDTKAPEGLYILIRAAYASEK